jgi:hypothetical protein
MFPICPDIPPPYWQDDRVEGQPESEEESARPAEYGSLSERDAGYVVPDEDQDTKGDKLMWQVEAEQESDECLPATERIARWATILATITREDEIPKRLT